MLLGCLLERYNQIDPGSAHKLKDKRDSDAHVSNYCAIEPTMRALKIKCREHFSKKPPEQVGTGWGVHTVNNAQEAEASILSIWPDGMPPA